MKLPWVSREVYESSSQRVDRLLDANREERRRYDALLDKYHALKVAGAVPVPAPPMWPANHSAPEPDEATRLIHEQSRGNPKLARMMLDQLRADRAAKRDETDILTAIRGGVPMVDGIIL